MNNRGICERYNYNLKDYFIIKKVFLFHKKA